MLQPNSELCIVFVGASLFQKQYCTWMSDVYYRSSGCFLTWYISPHPVVPYWNTTTLCTFRGGEACILFHSSPTFHMDMPLISTMVWNFKLKSLLSKSYFGRIYVLVLLLTNFEWRSRTPWESENSVTFYLWITTCLFLSNCFSCCARF